MKWIKRPSVEVLGLFLIKHAEYKRFTVSDYYFVNRRDWHLRQKYALRSP